MVHSLAVQARWLRKRLEYHLLANHLLTNAKALVFAGLYFQGQEANEWLHTGLTVLRDELPEQVLLDGGHFERSPMYHAIILEDVLDLLNLAATQPGCVSTPITDSWRETAKRMLSWLRTMTHPDGEISFFNDAAFGIAKNQQELGEYASRLGVAVRMENHEPLVNLAHSGYVRLEVGPAVALIDVAPIGADYFPSHAHADTLSFELSLFGQRVVVNSGTSSYEKNEERLRQRGTSAHSTVVIDDKNSSEVWSAFRVGRRASVKKALVTAQSGGGYRVEAEHDGYDRLSGNPQHRRVWEMSPTAMHVIDEIGGTGEHEVEIGFHMHPQCHVLPNQQGVVSLCDENERVFGKLSIDGPGEMKLNSSSYHPEFNRAEDNVRLQYRWKGKLPRRWVTTISWDEG